MAEDTVFEHERVIFLKGWSPQYLLPTERKRYSRSSDGASSGMEFPDIQCPSGKCSCWSAIDCLSWEDLFARTLRQVLSLFTWLLKSPAAISTTLRCPQDPEVTSCMKQCGLCYTSAFGDEALLWDIHCNHNHHRTANLQQNRLVALQCSMMLGAKPASEFIQSNLESHGTKQAPLAALSWSIHASKSLCTDVPVDCLQCPVCNLQAGSGKAAGLWTQRGTWMGKAGSMDPTLASCDIHLARVQRIGARSMLLGAGDGCA